METRTSVHATRRSQMMSLVVAIFLFSAAVFFLFVGLPMPALVSATVVHLVALRNWGSSGLPGVIPGLICCLMGLLGSLVYSQVASVATVSASFSDVSGSTTAAAPIFAIAAITYLAVFSALKTTPKRHNASDVGRVTVSSRSGGLAVLFGGLVLALLVVGRGSALWESDQYLDFTGPQFAVSIGSGLSLLAVALLSAAFVSQSGHTRLSALALLVAWSIVWFSLGTRQLALLPLVVLLAGYAVGRRPYSVPTNMGLLAASWVGLQMSLNLRASRSGHGFRPYVSNLLDSPQDFVIPGSGELLGNVLFAAPLTGHVALGGRAVSLETIWLSVSPLPGALSSWPEVGPTLRVNPYTPYSALGELGYIGLIAVFAYMAGAAVAFSLCCRLIEALPTGWRPATYLAVTGLSLLFSLLLVSYNLRTATRILYYSVVLLTLLAVSGFLSKRSAEGVSTTKQRSPLYGAQRRTSL